MAKKRRGLVQGNLERISSKVFDYYLDEITELVGHRHGVYALYKKDRLYYVGLASNLRGRVMHHLKDWHAKKWDSFSLYLIRNVNYLRELESLLVRIAEPKGNIARGRFARSENLLKDLDTMMEERDRARREEMMAGSKRRRNSRKRHHRAKSSRVKDGKPILHGMLPKGAKLRRTYLGKRYTAVVDRNGSIRLKGWLFNSPTAAAALLTKRPTNGWYFWTFEEKKGVWKKLNVLR
jgi:hypothetical protein